MNYLRKSAENLNRFQKTNLLNVLRTVSAGNHPQPVLEEPDKLIRVVELELRGNDTAVLNSFAKFAIMVGNHFNIECKTWNLRKPLHDRYTVLKAVHVQKKHRVQYETRTYYTFVQFKYLTGSTVDTLLEYLERNLPESVALKATKVELQKVPEHFIPPTPENK